MTSGFNDMDNYKIPKIESDFICFGGFTLPAFKVIRYNNNVVISEDNGIYWRWEFTDKNYLTPRWQCIDYSSVWTTLI